MNWNGRQYELLAKIAIGIPVVAFLENSKRHDSAVRKAVNQPA
jgi:hypothetical protein